MKKHIISGLLMALMLSGCWSVTRMFTPEVETAPVTPPESFSETGLVEMPPRFWEAFGDAELNRFVEQALEKNFTLRQAEDRLLQAQAVLEQTDASFWPTLTGSGSAKRTRTVTNSTTTTEDISFANYYSLGLSAGYELDLWGRVNANSSAAGYDVDARELDVTIAAITVAGEITSTWLSLLHNTAQRELLQQQLEIREQYLELIELRNRLQSTTGMIDILQQQQQVAAKNGELIENERQGKVLKNRLAVLLGLTPDQLTLVPSASLPAMPELPETGLPSELLRRRPDVLAVEASLGAANERLRSAVASRFPTISLSSQASASSSKSRDIFDDWFANLAANLLVPIIDGGQRAAAVDQNVAKTEETFHKYSHTVLEALAEVEDAISNEAHQHELVESYKEQARLTAQVAAQSAVRYRNGGLDYLRLLDTQLNEQQVASRTLAARHQELQYRLNLYRALAGDWDMDN